MFADVTSANVVGYTSTVQESIGMNCFVNQFMNIDSSNRGIKLSTLKPNEFFTMYGGSSLMLLEPSDGSTLIFFDDALGDLYPGGIQNPDGIQAMFAYCTADEAGVAGWYLQAEALIGDFSHPMNAYPVPAGTGFVSTCWEENAEIEIPGAL